MGAKKKPSVVEGGLYESKNHGKFKVVEYFGWDKVLVEFEDGYRTFSQSSVIKKGEVRNPYYPTVYGEGFLGEGLYLASYSGDSLLVYRVWSQILGRCYSEKVQTKQPSYVGCVCSPDWKCFQNFAMWYYQNYVDGWVVDKDLLVVGNKEYSPELCCFLPSEINSFLTIRRNRKSPYKLGVDYRHGKFCAIYSSPVGVRMIKEFDTEDEAATFHREQKGIRAKALAEKYKDRLSLAAYEALMFYDPEGRYRET